MAQIARKNGLLALEEKANALQDPFFKQAVMLVVDAVEAEKVREMLEGSVDNMAARHEDCAGIWDKASAFAPAFGMIGTLVGLINMLKGLNLDAGGASDIGENMSVAMITTFYGCILANLLFSPIAVDYRRSAGYPDRRQSQESEGTSGNIPGYETAAETSGVRERWRIMGRSGNQEIEMIKQGGE